MSTIQLSEELVRDIQKILVEHDPQAQSMGVAVQYLAAMMGLLVANFSAQNNDEKVNLMSQLHEFAVLVLKDHLKEEQKPSTDPAFGVWKPE